MTKTKTFWEHLLSAILETCDIWDTDYNSYNWDPESMTIFVTLQLRVTLDSIRNSCDVFLQSCSICLPPWCAWELSQHVSKLCRPELHTCHPAQHCTFMSSDERLLINIQFLHSIYQAFIDKTWQVTPQVDEMDITRPPLPPFSTDIRAQAVSMPRWTPFWEKKVNSTMEERIFTKLTS